MSLRKPRTVTQRNPASKINKQTYICEYEVYMNILCIYIYMKYLYLDKGENRKKGNECLALLAYIMPHSIANDYSQQCDSILEG